MHVQCFAMSKFKVNPLSPVVTAKQWVGSVVMATSWLPEKETEAPPGLCVLLRLAHQYGRWSRETVPGGCGFGKHVHGIDKVKKKLKQAHEGMEPS